MSFTGAAVEENGLQNKLRFHSQVFEYKKKTPTIHLICNILLFILIFSILHFKKHNHDLMSKETNIRYFRRKASAKHKAFLIGCKRALEINHLHI